MARVAAVAVAVVAVLVAAGAHGAEVPACKGPTKTFAPRSVLNAQPVDLEVWNNLSMPARIIYVDGAGKEYPMATIPNGAVHKQLSYEGHSWRLVAPPDFGGFGIDEFWVEADKPKVVIQPCQETLPPPAQVPSEWGPPAALVQHDKNTLLRDCEAYNFVSEIRSSGFHIICRDSATHHPRLVVFKDGLASTTATFDVPASITSLQSLLELVFYKIGARLFDHRAIQPGFFTIEGRRIQSYDIVDTLSTYFLFEGGTFIWPAVRVGHTVSVGNTTWPDRETVIRTVSLEPRVFEVSNFLTPEEADFIVNASKDKLTRAPVATKDFDVGISEDTWRRSRYFFFNSVGHPILQAIEQRVQNLTRVPLTHSEDPQVLRYDQTGFYSAHHDYFDPGDYASNPGFARSISGGRNRLATVFFYLNDLEEDQGGATAFPRANGLPLPSDYKDCSRGVRVRPEKGKVIVFYSMLPSGELDPLSLHGGCSVSYGEKWSVNFWIWNTPRPSRMADPTSVEVAKQLNDWSAPLTAVPASSHDEL